MVSARRTQATGRVAVACVAALWLLAGAAFVAPRGPAQERTLRGTGHELAARPFQGQSMAAQEQQTSWTSVMSIAAAFGLVAAMATAPVRAEEAAAPAPVDKMAQYKADAAKEEAARAKAMSVEERMAKETAKMKSQAALSPEFAATTAETPKASGGRKLT